MNQKDIERIALEQSALDCGCAPEDFLADAHSFHASHPEPQARRYLALPHSLNLVSYGPCVVATGDPALEASVLPLLERFGAPHALETPGIYALNDLLSERDERICFQAEYFLPFLDAISAMERPCRYDMRLLGPEEFGTLYLPEWSNALSMKRPQLDRLAFGAYDGDTLVGLAGASADCETMWQIGVDVLPAYRRRGIASALTHALALEILSRDVVPFYCAAWSNLPSVRNALRSGFRPAWVEATAKKNAFIQTMSI